MEQAIKSMNDRHLYHNARAKVPGFGKQSSAEARLRNDVGSDGVFPDHAAQRQSLHDRLDVAAGGGRSQVPPEPPSST